MGGIVILASCEYHFIRVHANLVQHPRNYKAIFPFKLQIGQFRIKGSTIQRFYTANMMSSSLMSVCPLYITTPCDFSLYICLSVWYKRFYILKDLKKNKNRIL